MKKLLAIALLMLAVPAYSGDMVNFPNFPNRAGGMNPFDKGEWWNNSSLTFYAPFTDPANPLYLAKSAPGTSLSFTRATPAIYTHPTTGFLTKAGNNLILQSENFSTTWAPTNFTITTDITVAPDGTTTADKLSPTVDNSATLIYQNYTSNSTSMINSIYAKQGSGATDLNSFMVRNTTTTTNLLGIKVDFGTGAITYETGSTGASVVDVGNGWWRISLAVSSGITSGDGLRFYVASLGSNVPSNQYVYLWGAQAEPALGGTYPGSYVKTTTAAASALRIESNGALIEGQRTNKALQSEVFKTTWTASNITIADDNTTGPDGATTADLLTATAGNATLTQSIATDNSVTHTFSIYLKRAAGTGAVQLNADNSTYSACTINSTTWTRCSVSNGLTDNTANHSPGIRIVTDTDAVYAWGGQYEAGAFASSYIPTTTAAVTRNRDQLTFATSGNVSGTVGTVAATYKTIANAGATSQYILDLNNAQPAMFINGADEKLSINDGATTTSFGTADTHGTVYKGASRWSSADHKERVVRGNGTVVDGVFDDDMNLGTNATIGDSGTSGSILWGWIKSLRIWNRSFSDSELGTITQ